MRELLPRPVSGQLERSRVPRSAVRVVATAWPRGGDASSAGRVGTVRVMLREWWERRRAQEAQHEAARQRLYEEYHARLQAGDADGMKSARDYGDTTSSRGAQRCPWL